MFITKKHLSRRHVLRGAGAAIALPLLDAMIPAATAQSNTALANTLRMGFIYIPHGAIMSRWTPAIEGAGFELPEILAPLKGYENQMTIVSGLRNKPAESPDPHGIIAGTWLRCVAPAGTSNPDDGITLDQIAARTLGQGTPFPSLELSTNGSSAGSYSSTISFRTPTQALPMEADPRKLYFRLFGQGDTDEHRERIASETGSLLDRVRQDAESLNIGEYLDSVRDVERQIQKLQEQDLSHIEIPDAPIGVPGNFPAHLDLMYSLMALAYQANLTRIATFMADREVSMRTYTHIGVSDAFHPLSHHQNLPDKLTRLAKVQSWYCSAFAKFVKTLADMPEGDGSVLDHSMILYGSCMSDSNVHNNDPVPSVILGHASGALKGGLHVSYPQDTPLANLMLTMLNKADIAVEKYGDSTGLLSGV